MVYFLSAATQYLGSKLRNITVAGKNIHAQCYDIAVHRKKFRLVPFRFVQSEANNAGKPDSFKFTPGSSPEFSQSSKGPKRPLYTRMTSERGQLCEYTKKIYILKLTSEYEYNRNPLSNTFLSIIN